MRLQLHGKGITTIKENNTISLDKTNYYKRRSGRIIYGKQNVFNGSIYLLPKKFDNYLSSADVPTIKLNDNIVNKKYFSFYWSLKKNYKKLESFSSGTGSKRLHVDSFLNREMYLPSLEIQNNVVNLLSSMDKFIKIYYLYHKKYMKHYKYFIFMKKLMKLSLFIFKILL